MSKFLCGLIMMACVFGVTTQNVGAAQSLSGVTLTRVAPRIVTPNGDSYNDVVFFNFDNTLTGLPLKTAVYDITGAKVARLSLDTSENALIWNGKDDSGGDLPSGIYIYSIRLGNDKATGTVVLAR